MNNRSKFSRAMLALAMLVGWRAHAELRTLNREQLRQAQVPDIVVSKLLDARIILVGQGNLCFDNGKAYDKAKGDQELLSYVELLRQLTIGSSVVTECTPGVMPAGSQDITNIN